MGAQRSHAKAAQGMGKARSVISAWASQWRWSERCSEWDAHIQREADAAHEAAIKDVASRHAMLARALQKKVAERLNAMKEHALDLDAGDIARWLDVAVKIERMSMGMSTQTVEHHGHGGGAIKLDVMRQARERLVEKLSPIDNEYAGTKTDFDGES